MNGCWNKGLRGQMRENRGEGECVWCMGLGARPERIPKASRRNGGRGMTQERHKKNDGAKKSTSLELAHETRQLNQIIRQKND